MRKSLLVLLLGGCSSSNTPVDMSANPDLSMALDMAVPLDLAMPVDLTPPADLLPPPPNFMFITSQKYAAGSLGGLSGADTICNNLASAASLPGTYVALLSTQGGFDAGAPVDAMTRIAGARGWIRVDGKPFGDTAASIFTQHAVFNTPNVDEHGNSLASALTITGTAYGGVAAAGETCGDWTNPSGPNLQAGESDATGYHWVTQGSGGCSATYSFYCFGIDRQVPLTFTKQTGRLAFVSTSTFTPAPGAGLTGADSVCATDATNAGFSGTFRALLATSTLAATDSSRFDTSAGAQIWVRPDGVPVVAAASDLPLGKLIAPINQMAAGGYADVTVFAGATTLTAAGSSSTTCTDYTSTSGNFNRGDSQYTKYFWQDGTYSCASTGVHLYCLQI